MTCPLLLVGWCLLSLLLLLPYTWSSMPEPLAPWPWEWVARCCLSLHIELSTVPHCLHLWCLFPLPALVQMWELRASKLWKGWEQW